MLVSIDQYEASVTYKLIKDIKEITKPLNKIGVVYFIYAELNDSHYINFLINNDNMIRNFINYDGLKYEIALSPHKVINSGLYSVSTITKPKEIKNYYKCLFNDNEVADQLIYIVDQDDIRKVYMFGVLDPSLINKEYLELFIMYFNDKAYHLINKFEPFKIPKNLIEYKEILNIVVKNFVIAQEEAFINNINFKYYKIKQLQKQYSLTTRELQCLELILQNKIAKEIANFLNLTTRTAETYIYHLKRKLNCHSKSEIIVKFFIK